MLGKEARKGNQPQNKIKTWFIPSRNPTYCGKMNNITVPRNIVQLAILVSKSSEVGEVSIDQREDFREIISRIPRKTGTAERIIIP